MYFYYSFSPVKIARLVARGGFTNFHTRCDDIRVIILNDCTHLYTDCTTNKQAKGRGWIYKKQG